MINTDRLIIRQVEISDAEQIFAYRSDAETNKYQGWIPNDLEQVEDFIENKVSKEVNVSGTWVQMSLLRKEDNKIIGDIGVLFKDEDDMQCEVGCTMNKEYHGQGFATEALHGVITYLFADLNKHRITSSIDPANIASISLVERLGFRKEAHHIESLFINEEWVDDIIYAILKREWK